MNDHTTHHSSIEIPYGYCQCGCGQKTKIAQKDLPRLGWKKGEPIRFIAGHNASKKAKRQADAEMPPWVDKYGLQKPYGQCQCGCGKDAPLAVQTDNLHRLTIQGMPQRFIQGHNKSLQAIDMFWKKVDRRGLNDCWEWQGDTYGMGYGRFQAHSKIYRAHQFSYRLHIGTIPRGMFVCHRCDNPKCVNPAHLFLGTPKDNMEDMIAKGRKRTTPGESNFHAKLTAKDVLRIRELYRRGAKLTDIAKQFNVSRTTASVVARRITWKSLP